MPSKKPASAKRARLPRRFNIEKQFRRDWEKLSRSGRFDMARLKQAMMLLIGNEPFGPEWLDHPLTGQWRDCRECHAGGDFLLIYRAEDDLVVFVRAGTHADLFE